MTPDRRIVTWEKREEGAYYLDPRYELREASDGRLEGYAVVYDAWSRDLGGFVERIAPGSIELREDVLATFNHDTDKLLGRRSSGTLRLRLDETGLFYSVELPDTGAGRDVRVLTRRRDVRGSSFTFRVLPKGERVQTNNGRVERTVTAMVVSELGPVTLPAYPDTTAAVRSLAGAMDHPLLPRLERFKRRLRNIEAAYRELQ